MLIGKNLGEYRILAKTRLGESDTVYKAVHVSRRQTYALSLVDGLIDGDEPEQRSFLEKLRQAQTLDHPNIAQTYPVEVAGQVTLIPFEFVYGQNLSEKIVDGPSTLDFTLQIALQISQALDHAHRRGLVHGRLTSNNLIVSPEGTIKIAEFAWNALPHSLQFIRDNSEFAGACVRMPQKPPLSRFAYQSPEQVLGYPAGVQSDLFSLGVILYELLVGRFLFEGEDQQELYRQIQERDLPKISEARPGVPSTWSRVLKGLLDRNPRKRYPSARELLEDLRKLNYGLPLDRLSFQRNDPSISRRSFFRRFLGEDEVD
jgi:eukaryotic-like serine/threonine-protein kinase